MSDILNDLRKLTEEDNEKKKKKKNSNDILVELRELTEVENKKRKTTQEDNLGKDDSLISTVGTLGGDIAPFTIGASQYMKGTSFEDDIPLSVKWTMQNEASKYRITPVKADTVAQPGNKGYDARQIAQSILGEGYTDKELDDRIKELDSIYSNTKTYSKDFGKKVEAAKEHDTLAMAQNTQLLASTKMPGTDHSILDEMYEVAALEDGDEKDKRKDKILREMSALGLSQDDYALYSGDSNFDLGVFGGWLGNSFMEGLAGFNQGMASTADLILGGKLMQKLGWENNPISAWKKWTDAAYEDYQYKADFRSAQLGGADSSGWDFGSDVIQGAAGALPHAIMALMSAGTSTAGSAIGATGSATTSTLTTKAAYESGNLLTKAGITSSAVAKNPQYWMSFARTYGQDYEQAKEKGANDFTAVVGATTSSLVNALIETGLDGGSGIQGLPNKVKNGGKEAILNWAISAAEEGGEEMLQSVVSNTVTKALYDSDQEIFNEKELLTEGVMGAAVASLMGGGQVAVQGAQNQVANQIAKQKAAQLTDVEQTVVDSLVENEIVQKEENGKKLSINERKKIRESVIEKMEKGTIKVEEIEEILGGESYKTYDTEWNKLKSTDDYKELAKVSADEKVLPALQKEYDKLYNMTGAEKSDAHRDRQAELKSRIEAVQANKSGELFAKLAPEANRVTQLRDKMRGEVSTIVKDSRLAESYREFERSKQDYAPDMTKYTNENAKKTVQNIIDSGLGDNSNAFHAKVDLMAHAAADVGVTFTLTEDSQLVGTEHYQEGYTTNGFIDDNGNIVINMDSKRLVATIVGHEVGHEFQKAGLDKKTSKFLRDYCIKKEGLDAYNKRISNAEIAYKNKKNTTAEIEVANDLLGEYIFNDENFIKHLSTADRNVFQKVYDKIKYMCNIATAGSEEKRLLEKAKHEFEKAWREIAKVKTDAKTDAEANDETKYSLGEIIDENNNSYGIGVHLDSTLLDTLSPDERIEMVKEYVKELGGTPFTAYDSAGNAVDIMIAKPGAKFKNKNGKRVPATKDLTNKRIGRDVKQEAIALVDELILTAEYDTSKAPQYPHGWLDNNGQNDWEYWTTYIQDKNNTIWKATLNVANSADGAKILYDISPIKKVGRSIELDTIPTDTKVAQEGEKVKYEYSMSKDNQGNELSQDLLDKLQHSQVRDENGRIKAMYHGTPNGSIAEFKPGTYFTDNKEYADRYQNPGASSISTGKVASNPKTFQVYLDIRKPFDLSDPEAKRIYIEEYIKGGNALGINPYLTDAQYAKINTIDWTEGEDLKEFLIDNDYDYDGLVLDEGADGGYGEDVKYRGKSYVIFNSSQVVRADNTETQYSMSKADDQYMEAVNIDDMISAEKAVEEYANLAMPDSKIRDADGKLLPVYHGTSNMFYEFAPTKEGGKNGTAEGFGIYLSDNQEVTKLYGDRQIKMYANITKPATSFDKTISRTTLVKLIKDTCQKEAQRMVAEDGYGNVREAIRDTWISNYVDTYSTNIEQAYREVAQSILEQNDNDKDIVHEVMFGMAIRDYDRAMEFYRESLTPVTGIDGFITEWDNPNTGETSTIYLAFDSSQLKSADAVTRDDNGNVIPLSERFDPTKKDIRFSISKDNNEYSPYREAPADFGYHDPLDDFAPVRSDISPVANAKTEQNVPIVDERELFPDDLAPMPVELDSLMERKANLEARMREAIEAEDLDTFTQINEEYDSVMTRIDEINAEESDRLSTLDDADAPPVRSSYTDNLTNGVRLTAKTTAEIAKEVKTSLGVSNKQMYDVHKLIEAYSNGEISSREQLFQEIKDKFGTQQESILDERMKEVKSYLHSYRISVSDSIKSEIADYGDLQRRNRGRIIFSRQGVPVDAAYQEMSYNFPEYFPEDITNPTDQLLQILEVANSEAYSSNTYQIDDETIWGVTNDIIDYVGDVKYVQDQRFANQSSKAAFDALMENADDIAPVKGQPIQKPKSKAVDTGTVQEKVNAKIANVETELANNQQNKAQSWNAYSEEIDRLQFEYDSKQNKNSIAANNLLRRIERAKRMRGNIDADYAKRISDLEKRLEKYQSPEYKRSEQRRSKYDEYKNMWEAMLGDTSTWKDKALGLSYKTTTMRRFLRDVVRDEYGKKDFAKADAIYDELETKYDHHEAQLKRESGKLKESFFNLKLNKHEDKYAHMVGEFRHNPETTLTQEMVDDYYNKHKNSINKAKVDHAIEEARNTFDSLIVRVNEVLNEQGMKEIPYRKGYFPHFQNPKQGFLGKLLNWKKVDTEIPTSIAGLTENFNPERSWQSFNKQRKGDSTDYSLYQGLDTYIHGALDWIYHIEDIQKRRSLENYIRYIHSEEGVQARIDEIRANETYDADEAQKQIELALDEAKNPLNNLVTELRARTNTLANKKSSMDRGMEEATNRKIYSTMTNINNRVNANMVVGSFSSALTNFIPMVQSWHQVSPFYTVRGLGDFVRSSIRDDGMVARSDFLTNRLKAEEKLYQTGWDKISDKAGFMMNVIDSITSQTVWRSKYLQNKHEGMSESQAIKDADQFAKNLMAGRSRGNMPTIFESKNPLIKICTAFQLEVANQYGYMFKDTPQDSKNAVRLVKGYATAFMGAYLYNALFSSITGRDAAFDPIGIIEDLLRDLGFGDDEEKEETKDVILNFADNVADEMPFISGFTGGGRIPMSSAMPYEGIGAAFEGVVTDMSEEDYKSIAKEMLNPLYYLIMPVGGGQIKKTVEGLSMFSDDHPVAGSYTDSGALRFPVEDTFGNKVKAAMFGQWSSKNARDYIENGRKPLSEDQLQEYIDLEMPIQDYWAYRDGLKAQETLEDKFEYINSLDVSVEQKNIMINNVVDRKEQVDMERYDEMSDYEEFDFYSKNPEKYEFLEENGISYSDYTADEDTKEHYDNIYSWVKNNPNKVTVANAVTDDIIKYKGYTSALDDIRADKDSKGNSISGSAKEKKKDYIFGLDLDEGQKYILFKTEYPKDDTYNNEIIDYLNSRDDISYDEMVTILEELGFIIGADGVTITWD